MLRTGCAATGAGRRRVLVRGRSPRTRTQSESGLPKGGRAVAEYSGQREGPESLPTGLGGLAPPQPPYSLDVRWGGVADGLAGRWRDVMTVVSGRGAHVPMLVGVLMEALQVMSLLQEEVFVLLLKALFFLKVMMLLEEVLLSLSSPPTPTTRPCRACLTQNISKAGDPDLGRGERTH